MDGHWHHGTLYAVTPTDDPLAHAPEPYLAVHVPEIGTRFLYAPHLAEHGDGPHPVDALTIEAAADQGFDLPGTHVIARWTDRHTALVHILRHHGIIPPEPGPIADAERVLRITHPEGRLAQALQNSEQWPGSTVHIHHTPHDTFSSATFVLRTTNPYQARLILIMLGADRDDIATVTGTTN